jgi:hypothetical protein
LSEFIGNTIPDTVGGELSRRTLIRQGFGLVASLPLIDNLGTVVNGIEKVADRIAYGYDCLRETEDIIPGPIPVLEPRKDNTPTVLSQPHAEPVNIEMHYELGDKEPLLSFTPPISVWSEHANRPVDHGKLAWGGTGIITTAEGPIEGKQEYCRLFTAGGKAMAVGYEGGLYTYDPGVGDGEWVRVLTHKEGQALSSEVVTTTPWEALGSFRPEQKMLIQDTVTGTETFQALGYQPWAAVLSSTQMPYMEQLELTPDSCAQSMDDLKGENSRGYMVTEHGDLLDLNHLQAKAGETLALFTSLYYQYLTGEPHPMANIHYFVDSDAKFVFSVDPVSLRPETLIDTVFSIMITEGMLMEGISQRYGIDNTVIGDLWPSAGGMNPEDPFSNSLAVVGMLTHVQQSGVLGVLETSLRRIGRSRPEVADIAIKALLKNVQPLLVERVLTDIGRTHGIRKQETTRKLSAVRGLYPLIPTKVNDEDGATPTRIDLWSAGITPNNPRVHHKALHVPATEVELARVLDRVRKIL